MPFDLTISLLRKYPIAIKEYIHRHCNKYIYHSIIYSTAKKWIQISFNGPIIQRLDNIL